MSDWAKSDGAKIEITFDQPITSDASGNQSYFTVTAKEYTYVPGGELVDVVKAVKSVTNKDSIGSTAIILEMEPLQRFESAVGEITVAYSGGNLQGKNGLVESLSQTFTPTELIYKGDQNDQEHIEFSSISGTGALILVKYFESTNQDQGHISVEDITASGALTNVK